MASNELQVLKPREKSPVNRRSSKTNNKEAKEFFVDTAVTEEDERPKYKVTFMRWVQLFNVCWMTVSAYVSWTCMSPIGYQVSKNYGVSLAVVNTLPAMMAVVEICCSLPVAHLIEKHGSSKAIFCVSILNAIGFSIKCLTNVSFYLALVGQILPSIAAQVSL